MNTTSEAADIEAVRRALSPSAVTIVGASEKSPITSQLVDNLRRETSPFQGPIQLVNRSGASVLGIEVAIDTSAVDNPGLVYLLIPGAAGASALAGFGGRPDGVVVYADGSRSAEGYEHDIAAWAAAERVAVFGPQSNGVVSGRSNLLGLLLPVVDPLAAGGTSILAQSGGILGTLVKSMLQAGVGIDVVIEYGTGAVWDVERLALAVLARDDTKVLALHIEDVPSLASLVTVGRRARELHKRLVLLLAGTTDIGSMAAASHSGAASTPRGLVRDLMAQCGAVYAESLDEMVVSLSTFESIGHRNVPHPGVLLVSDSGGGAVLLADALEHATVPLPPPTHRTREILTAVTGSDPGAVLNPYDFGGGNIANIERRQAVLEALVTDPTYGLCVLVSTLGLPIQEQTLHIKHIESFIATITAAGKIPVVAVPGPLQVPDRASLAGLGQFVLGLGTGSSVFALKAMRATHGSGGVDGGPISATVAKSDGAVALADGGRVVRLGSPTVTAELLARLPVSWPRYVVGSGEGLADEAATAIPPPYVVKAETGLAHRASAGGVLRNIADIYELRWAVKLLRHQFKAPVSVHAAIVHSEEYFVGAARTDTAESVVLGGLGGSRAESSARALLAPFEEAEARRLVADITSDPDVGRQLVALLRSVQQVMLDRPEIAALDLNPVVVGQDRALWALDAKAHLQGDENSENRA